MEISFNVMFPTLVLLLPTVLVSFKFWGGWRENLEGKFHLKFD
jgi:hypothetical protein